MFPFKKKLTVVTHNGDFHADDVFACAAISLWAEKNNLPLKIIRDRDEKITERADILVDVGMKNDSNGNRFDHHQKEGAGIRDNKIPYASFGLVWKKYGQEICGSKIIADRVDKKLVIPIDARDNGIAISVPNNDCNIYDYRIGNIVSAFNSTSEEKSKSSGKQFEKILFFAKEIIKREIVWAEAMIQGEAETLDAIKKQNGSEILVLDKNIEWHETVSKAKNIKFVVYKYKNNKDWCAQAGRDDLESYNSRANFPKNWWGLRGEELAKVSGIKDALFCVKSGWLSIAKSKEGAIAMVQKSLEN